MKWTRLFIKLICDLINLEGQGYSKEIAQERVEWGGKIYFLEKNLPLVGESFCNVKKNPLWKKLTFLLFTMQVHLQAIVRMDKYGRESSQAWRKAILEKSRALRGGRELDALSLGERGSFS